MADLGLERRPHAASVRERIVFAFERFADELRVAHTAQIVDRIAEAAGAVA